MPTPAPVAPKKFLTNQGENTLSKRLEKILPLTEDFDCIVGYFFISGFFRLYPALESVKKIRILIGLKNEQVVHGLIQIANDESGESAPSTAEVKRTFGGMMRSELIQAQDSLAIETGIRKFIEWIRSDKLEVKLYRERAKLDADRKSGADPEDADEDRTCNANFAWVQHGQRAVWDSASRRWSKQRTRTQ